MIPTSRGSRMGLVLAATTLLLAGTSGPAAAQYNYDVLHAFGAPGGPPANPYGILIQGTDGALYGTTLRGGASGLGTVFTVNPDGSGFATLFSFNGTDGANPYAGLTQGTDGALYGTTLGGGALAYGTVFKINPDGSGFATLFSFSGTDGANPAAGLMQGTDGALYGTTLNGSASGRGTVFRVNPDGTGFTTLLSFDGTDGSDPFGALTQGANGALYGTTYSGGASGRGTVFTVNPDGSGFATLFSFNGTDGANPYAGLTQGTDGALYGTTLGGGALANGTVFKINPDGSGFATLFSFSGTDGATPQAGLMQGTDGALYGTTLNGGASGLGSVFTVNPDGSGFATLFSFTGTDGANPAAGLTQGTDGALYGTTYIGGGNGRGTVFKINPNGSGFASLLSFKLRDGTNPHADLTQGTDGALYGTTRQGGTYGYGTAFSMSPEGSGFATLWNFDRPSYGAYPSSLTQGSDGALYGTTQEGGEADAGPDRGGYGTIFRLSADGSEFRNLRYFDNFIYGANPIAGLTPGMDGTLYGTTSGGGWGGGCGTFFALKPDLSFSSFNSFNCSNGANPHGRLTLGMDGALYGTTANGGSGYGTVFRINPDGSEFATLFSFNGTNGGANPYAGLTQVAGGALYGTTAYGGSGYGTLFKINPDGSGFATLFSFNGTDGANPYAGLTQGADGALYGTTAYGGSGHGTLFKINPDGSGFTTLFNLNGTDGANPYAGLTRGSDGTLYGTTENGGPLGGGVVFRLRTAISAPAANAGPDQTLECAGPAGTVAVLDGSASLNPSGGILTYEWRDASNAVVGTTAIADLTLGLGAHTFTLTVEDGGGQSSSDTVVVTVLDSFPPVISLQNPLVIAEKTSPAGAFVDVLGSAGATASDACMGGVVPVMGPGPTTYPGGDSLVTLTATDASGNVASATVTVRVQDTTAPILSLPSDIAVAREDASWAVVEYTASATDVVDGAVVVDCAPASGTVFPIATTEVVCTATDAAGNSSSGSFFVTVLPLGASGQIITTSLGGVAEAPGLSIAAGQPRGVAVDASGNMYFSLESSHSVYKQTPDGTVRRVAGIGVAGSGGSGIPATRAAMNLPYGISVDASGNLYIADHVNSLVRKVSPAGQVTTVAGTGLAGYSGDGGPATSARLSSPSSARADAAGNLYIADQGNHCIRRVDAATGSINAVAGVCGVAGSSADGQPATQTRMRIPHDMVLDAAGTLYIADSGNNVVLKVDGQGLIQKVAGVYGQFGYSGDGGDPNSARLWAPVGMGFDAAGDLYIADNANQRIRKVTPGVVITTVAGTGVGGFNGDGPATSTHLNSPMFVAVAGDGSVYVSENANHRIRKVSGGNVTTVAGDGSTYGFGGDGDFGTRAGFALPPRVVVDGSGNVYVSDEANHRVRKVSAATGRIETLAGTGYPGFSGDGGAGTSAQLQKPAGIAVDGSGNVYIAEHDNGRIRKVTPGGVITTQVSGLSAPYSLTIDSAGDLYVGELGSGVVERIAPDGTRTTVASGLASPYGLDWANGDLYIAELGAHRVRKLELGTGTFTTVAGTGSAGFSGDGGPATAAQLNGPYDVTVDGSGRVYIADTSNNRVRKVRADGTIQSIAGNGIFGFGGDGGPALAARLADPTGMAFDLSGDLLIADFSNARIRKVMGISNQAPVASAGADQALECAGPGGNAVTLDGTGSSDPEGYALAYEWRDGTNAVVGTTAQVDLSLSLGTHVFTLTVTDVEGDSATDTVTVMVADTQAPSLSVTTPLIVVEQTSPAGALVDVLALAGASASDACTGGAVPVVGPGPTTYPGGDSLVTLTATDASGNVASATVTVRVQDTTAPVLSLPSDIVVEREDGSGAVVEYTATATDAVDGSVVVDCTPASGTDFPIATTEVVCTATDAAGNSSSGSFYVTVLPLGASGQIITTSLGGVAEAPGLSIAAGQPRGVAVDASGNMYFSLESSHSVYKQTPDGTVRRVAGIGVAGSGGSGIPATRASMNLPYGISVDVSGNLYIADHVNSLVRKVTPGGQVSTVAGTGVAGYSGDGGPATSARLSSPSSARADAAGNLYIADQGNHCIRKVDATTDDISTVVGSCGTPGVSYDGQPVAQALLRNPYGIAFDSAGVLHVADTSNNVVLKVDAGVIRKVAGVYGQFGYSGDGGDPNSARLWAPVAVGFDGSGALYIDNEASHTIRKVTGGVITTVAGTGSAGFNGDGPATSTLLNSPTNMAVAADGTIYITDYSNHRIRKVSGGSVSTVAGDGSPYGFGGDGDLGTRAGFALPPRVAVDGAGNVYVSDEVNHRVRKVSAATGRIETIAGTGYPGSGGDGGPGTSAQLQKPSGIAVDGSGNVYVAEHDNGRIRKVTPGGVITTHAASVTFPYSLTIDSAGNLYVGELGSGVVERIAADGTRTTVATGLASPYGLDWANGDLYIAELGAHRVRKLELGTGLWTTVAGTGSAGFSGDGGPATSAQLNAPYDVSVDASGRVYIADTSNNRVRKVRTDGTIQSIAGNGIFGFGGDGGPALAARLADPTGLAFDLSGDLLIADYSNARIRKVTGLANQAPVASAGADQALECGGPGGNGVTLDGTGSSDPDGYELVYEWRDGANAVVGTTAQLNLSLSLGTHVFTLTVTDVEGDSATDTVTVTVSDTQAAALSVTTPLIVVEQTSPAGALVDVLALAGASASDACTGGAIPVLGPGPTTYPAGDTLVTLTATDASGNVASATVTVRVQDTTAPVLSLPGDIAVEREDASGAVVEYTASATDAVNGSVAVDCTPASGTDFPIATTEVVCTATDAAGNSSSGSFYVTVLPLGASGHIITTIAGNGSHTHGGDGGPALDASFVLPARVAVDSAGNIFISDHTGHRVRRIDAATGIITTYAGTGSPGYSGDGGPATSAQLQKPSGISLDAAGNLYIAEHDNGRIRKVTPGGVITTHVASVTFPYSLTIDSAGNLYVGELGVGVVERIAPDGTRTTVASGLASPYGLDWANGDLYIAELGAHRVRKLELGTGLWTTVAGTGSAGFSGDGGPATSAQLNAPYDVSVDGSGRVYIADTSNNRVRKVRANGTIQSIAGNGIFGYGGDGGPALAARLADATGLVFDLTGNLLIADLSNARVRKVIGLANALPVAAAGVDQEIECPGPGDIAVTLDGSGSSDPEGYALAYEWRDGANAVVGTTAQVNLSLSLGTHVFTLTVTDVEGDSATDTVTVTVADTQAPSLFVTNPLLVVEQAGPSGTLVDVLALAGASASDVCGGGAVPVVGPGLTTYPAGDTLVTLTATDASGNVASATVTVRVQDTTAPVLSLPGDIAVEREDASGAVVEYTATATDAVDGSVVVDCTPPSGTVLPIATTEVVCTATDAAGNSSSGSFYVTVLPLGASGHIITTIAGNGSHTHGGDDGPALDASFVLPARVAVDSAGNVYISDHTGHRVRRIDAATGIITTYAGTGSPGYNGDGGPATSAQLQKPSGISLDAAGNLYIAEHDNHSVRKVAPDGTITTLASGFSFPYSLTADAAGNVYVGELGAGRVQRIAPDGQKTVLASGFSFPYGVALDGTGGLYVVELFGHRVRRLDLATSAMTPVAGTGSPGFSGDGGSATSAELRFPYDAAVDASGRLYIADTSNNRVRKVRADGKIQSIAGNGLFGYSGDGGPALAARLADATGLAFDLTGNLLIADLSNARVRKVIGLANALPLAVAGADQGIECPGPGDVAVTLDGTESSDPEGGVLAYEWRDASDSVIGTTAVMNLSLGLGTHVFTLRVTDEGGDSATDTMTVAVLDTVAPVISVPTALIVVEQASPAGTEVDVLAMSGASATDVCKGGAVPVNGPGPTTYPAGDTVVTLTATDASGNTASASVTVRVQDTTPPTVSVTRPNGGEILFTGTSYLIEWAASDAGGFGTFDVASSVDGGATFSPVAECTALPGSARSCPWLAPGPTTSVGRIRVTARDTAGNTSVDGSNANFSVQGSSASVTVTGPNTAVTWRVGEPQWISWSHKLGSNSTVNIDVSRDGGASWTPVAAGVPNKTATTGEFYWTVTGPATSRALVRVSWSANSTVNDSSNTTFTIQEPYIVVNAPNTAVTWKVGQTKTIKWNHNLSGERFRIEISRDGGATWSLIYNLTPAIFGPGGSYDWVVTGPATTNARVRVSWYDIARDVSDVSFTINP